MTTLTAGKQYLISFVKKDKSLRTMLCLVNEITEKHAYVTDLELYAPRTVTLESILSVNVVKAVRLQAETALETVVTDVNEETRQDKEEELKTALKALEQLKNVYVKPKYNITKREGKYVVKMVDRVVGTVYSVKQIEKLIEFDMKYKR